MPPQDLVAAVEARTGRPWAHTWTQVEALVGETVVAALRQAKREGERQTQDTNSGAGKGFVLSCEHTVVSFDMILAGASSAETTSGASNAMARAGGAAGQVDADTGSGGGADARLPRPLRPYLVEASSSSFGTAATPLTDRFAQDLLSWLTARAEGAAVAEQEECRPHHAQPPGSFGFRRIVPPCSGPSKRPAS